MLKKHFFLQRFLRRLDANSTVVFVDAFDVLFQRPLSELLERYDRLAQPHLAQYGVWPVIYGGDLNCWPFPHNARLRLGNSSLHRIPADAALSADYHKDWRYPLAGGAEIGAREVCGHWLARHSPAAEAPRRGRRRHFPFVCAGSFVGRVASLRRVLQAMFALYLRTGEYHDQALIPLVLLAAPRLGFVDRRAELFFSLHGHDELGDLERPLCRGSYFEDSAPRLRSGVVPSVLHFNGNGKRHLWRCVEEFRRFQGDGCHYWDVDRNAQKRRQVLDLGPAQELLSLLGSACLWISLPSLAQHRSWQHTVLALLGSSVATFAVAPLLHEGRLEPGAVRSAPLAGGVATIGIADLLTPFQAMAAAW